MTTSAIAIGVDRTGGLPPLGGASAGARDFADWATRQGMAVKLFTDENNQEVTLAQLQDAVEEILKQPCDKLVLYFAGHGFLLSPQVELWLLSKAPGRATEAVNLLTSRDNARYSRVEHVIFVSDACRSGGPTHRHRSVTGGSVFPTPANFDFDGKLDTFYATRPGDVALEYRDETEAVANYKGLFTECLLEALAGKEPTVIEEFRENSRSRWLVTSHRLEGHLKSVVPRRAEQISVRLSQNPMVIPEAHPPLCFVELASLPPPGRVDLGAGDAPPPGRGGPGAPLSTPAPDLTDFVAAMEDDQMSLDDAPAGPPPQPMYASLQPFAEQLTTLASARGRGHFETRTGFTVFGPVASAVAGEGLRVDVEPHGDLTHIRVYDPMDWQGRSLLIELGSGLGSVLAIKPGYIGAVSVEESQVVDVSYTPSDNVDFYELGYSAGASERIERRRAFAAAASRHGVFQLPAGKAEKAGDYLRTLKLLDPTLGIYAAYAYFQAGRMQQVLSVLRYMKGDPPPVPFDVALLARFPQELIDAQTAIAPFCPMLRQGWAALDLHPPSAQALADFRPLLLPSLWTTFTPEGVARARQALEGGEWR